MVPQSTYVMPCTFAINQRHKRNCAVLRGRISIVLLEYFSVATIGCCRDTVASVQSVPNAHNQDSLQELLLVRCQDLLKYLAEVLHTHSLIKSR
jgi:hypothetical protein